MKKRISIILSFVFAFALLLGGTAAFAQSYASAPPTGSPSATTKPSKLEKVAERLAFLKEIQPTLSEIATNRQQVKTLQSNLVAAKQTALKHIEALKADLSKVTPEQLAKISDLVAQVKNVRIDFNSSNTDMAKQIHTLRGNRRTRDYEALKAAYQNVIHVQQERIDNFNKLIGLYNQISLV